MNDAPSKAFRILTRATLAQARIEESLARALRITQGLTDGFLLEAFTADELSVLSVALFDQHASSYDAHIGLFDWERQWYEADLPPTPARILVGGAGSGREVLPLIAQGYSVDAFEPASNMSKKGSLLTDVDTFFRCTYEDLSRAVLDGTGGPAQPVGNRQYDAVILGWGSINHVLAQSSCTRLFKACDRLAPKGPVLASFFIAPEADTTEPRALTVGRRIGNLVGRARGSEHPRVEAVAAWHMGFAHRYTEAEIRSLANAARREVTLFREPYPHATFRPPAANPAPAAMPAT